MDIIVKKIAVPLREDTSGTFRVARTRVTLDVLLESYRQGHSAEEIVGQFPALNLFDVYAVIAYYLANKAELDEYLEKRHIEALAMQEKLEKQFPNTAIRERLLKIREAQKAAKTSN